MVAINTEKDKYISPEEFEIIQDSFDCKVEYSNGNIIMHPDTSDYHNEIVGNISAYLKLYLKGSKCKV